MCQILVRFLFSCLPLYNITVSNWQRSPKGTIENPTIIDSDIKGTIKVDNNEEGLLYTIQEVEEGVIIKEEREEDIITNSEVELEKRFDSNSKSDFNNDIDSDKDIDDKNI